MTSTRLGALAGLCLTLLAAPALLATQAPDPLVVFVVRHADKLELDRDPGLSPAGVSRVASLVATLRHSAIDQVHTTDFRRTRDTARPVAAALGAELHLYAPSEPETLVERLRAAGGRHLVVGHSNTVPPLVSLLGGEPGSPIDEPGEYDRLYVVTVAGRSATTVRLSYGDPYQPQ